MYAERIAGVRIGNYLQFPFDVRAATC